MIRHNTKYAALDTLKMIVAGIIGSEEDFTTESGLADNLLHLKVWTKPEHIAILLGRNHMIKESIINILRPICRNNGADDVYIRFEDASKKNG